MNTEVKMVNPCNRECRERKAGCQIDCERRRAYADYMEHRRKEHRDKIMIDSYICEGILRNRRKYGYGKK